MEEAWKRKREAEAEAVDGRLKEAEAEAKEKLTAVASLLKTPKISRWTDLDRYICTMHISPYG